MSPQTYSPRQPMADPSGQLRPCVFRTSSGDETASIVGGSILVVAGMLLLSHAAVLKVVRNKYVPT
jgi:hypothetical protein